MDPNQLFLFDTLPNPSQEETGLVETDAVTKTCKPDGKKKESRRNRELLEGLPVVEVIVEPADVDLNRYRRIGEERTRTLEFEPGKLYVKETVRPKYGLKNNLSLPKEGESGVIIVPFHFLLYTNVWQNLPCWPKYFYSNMNIMFPFIVRLMNTGIWGYDCLKVL